MSKHKWEKYKQRRNNYQGGENYIEVKIGKKRIITYEKQNTNGEVCIIITNTPTTNKQKHTKK